MLYGRPYHWDDRSRRVSPESRSGMTALDTLAWVATILGVAAAILAIGVTLVASSRARKGRAAHFLTALRHSQRADRDRRVTEDDTDGLPKMTRLSGEGIRPPAVSRRVGPLGPHARRVFGGRGGAERRRLDPIRLNSATNRLADNRLADSTASAALRVRRDVHHRPSRSSASVRPHPTADRPHKAEEWGIDPFGDTPLFQATDGSRTRTSPLREGRSIL